MPSLDEVIAKVRSACEDITGAADFLPELVVDLYARETLSAITRTE